MCYKGITLNIDLLINKLFTIHYFEYTSNFSFSGEKHDFWELLYVDKGEVEVIADDREFTLKKGEVIFHKPNEFHSLKANGHTAPNLVVISFESFSKAMDFFNNKVLTVNETERNLMAQIILEAENTFSSRLDDPWIKEMVRSKQFEFASEQLILLYLQLLLIQLHRVHSGKDNYSVDILSIKVQKKYMDEPYNRIYAYMEKNINKRLTLKQICEDNLIGCSKLQKLFQEKSKRGVIDCFSRMKINEAKELIRDDQLNYTQIAYSLGYTSIHYFSRQFKKITGMTPSEYSSSVKALLEEETPKE